VFHTRRRNNRDHLRFPAALLGLLDEETLARPGGAQTTAETVMRVGPTTVWAHEDTEALVQRIDTRHVPAVLVTDLDGRLLGVFIRGDAERVLGDRRST
jgi:hypothetical protein